MAPKGMKFSLIKFWKFCFSVMHLEINMYKNVNSIHNENALTSKTKAVRLRHFDNGEVISVYSSIYLFAPSRFIALAA